MSKKAQLVAGLHWSQPKLKAPVNLTLVTIELADVGRAARFHSIKRDTVPFDLAKQRIAEIITTLNLPQLASNEDLIEKLVEIPLWTREVQKIIQDNMTHLIELLPEELKKRGTENPSSAGMLLDNEVRTRIRTQLEERLGRRIFPESDEFADVLRDCKIQVVSRSLDERIEDALYVACNSGMLLTQNSPQINWAVLRASNALFAASLAWQAALTEWSDQWPATYRRKLQ